MAAAMTIAAAGLASAAGKSAEPQLSMFNTQARVEIGVDGKILAVQPDPALPPVIGQAIQSAVLGWRFAAPSRAGQPVGGVTFVQIAGCAVPVGDGLRMAFDYRSNGPGRSGQEAPRYPVDLARRGVSAALQLTYRVQADGTAVVEQVAVEKGDARVQKGFRRAIEEWIGSNRFQPELLDGQPVATRVSFPVEFMMSTKPFQSQAAVLREMKAQQQAWAADSTSCKTALGNAAKLDRTVVLDSPFKLLPAG